MIANTQVEIECSVMEINMLQIERTRMGHANNSAGASTTSLNLRMSKRREKARKQIAVWQGWHAFMVPDSAAAAPLPFDEDKLLNSGQFPWLKALSGDTVSKEQLQLRLHRAKSEMARTEEQKAWFAGDAANILRVYLFQQHKLAQTLISMKADVSPAAAGIRYMLKAQLRRVAQRSQSARQLFKQRGGLLHSASGDDGAAQDT